MTESLFRRLLLRFALVPILSLCIFLAVLGIRIHQINLNRTQASQANAILLQSTDLLQSMIDEESSIRGYLVTRDPLFLQPYREASYRLGRELPELSSSSAGNSSILAKVTNIDSGFKEFNTVNQALLKSDLPQDAVYALLRQQKQAMDTLRGRLADLIGAEYNYREESRKEITTLFGTLPAIGIGGGALVALLLVWHGIYLFREITKAFGEQLAESEKQRDSMLTTLKSIGDAVIVCDRSGRVTLMNPTAEDLTGWTTVQALGQSLDRVFRIVNETTRETVESPVAKVARLGVVVELANHTVLIRKDGAEIPIDDSGAPIRDANGSLTGIIMVFRSIAERREAEKALRESQARFQSIYTASLEYIGILNPAGQILDCNRASLTFADIKREEVVGKQFWDAPWFAYTRGAPEMVREAVAQVARGKVLRTELPLRRPSGEIITFDFSLAPVFDANGKVIFIVPEGRDIGDLKRVDEALRASEERLRIATETARLGTWELDLVSGRMESSGICREHFGRSPNDPFRYEDLLNATYADDRPQREASVQQAIEQDSVYRTEHRTEWPDGSIHWILASGRALRDEEGMPVRMIGVTLDVTDRRRAEAALLQSEKLAAVGRLAASIAHEINNPLESVTNLIYLARMGNNTPEVHGHLELAERELRRASVITTQTLRFHKQSSKPRAVTSAELFESVLSIYQGRIANSHVQLKRRDRAASPIVGFEGEIRQVLNNLVGNAIDALQPAGKGCLFLRSREGTEWKTGRRGLLLTIADTGSGISSQLQDKIFEPFFTTKGISGTGLGLWVSKEIVDRHEGVLRVRSRQEPMNSWTVFTLFLPFESPIDAVSPRPN